MKVYDAASIRNVALVGHSGSGKTQLAAAILVDAGMINRFGKVDDGTTVTDFDEEEIARKHTLSASLAYAEWNKHKINLIDTPGIGNFLSDARAALRVADAARRRRRRRRRRHGADRKGLGGGRRARLPRLVVLNRLDRERASLERTLQSLRELVRPHGHSHSAARSAKRRAFRGVVDLVPMKALRLSDRRQRQVHRERGAGRDGVGRRQRRARRSSRWWPRPTRR